MPPILITLGDPAGIGPEVTLKAIKECSNHSGIILFGHPESAPSIPIYNGSISQNETKLSPIEGKISTSEKDCPNNASIAYESIQQALIFSQTTRIQGLVTAPISKAGMKAANIKTTDHTSMLKSFFNCPDAGMAFYSPQLKVMLATIHIPLMAVENALTKACIQTSISNSLTFAATLGIKKPRIGIAGLNPHAGEGGQFGSFEQTTLQDVLSEQSNDEATIIGPISPDIIFRQAVHGAYDIVIALYHDQGLIPLKLLAFDEGVNTTIGLPIHRSSPDHGTAYDIAGKNIANPTAMISAINYIQSLTT
ncbi:MAG: 4-hydroxythreonine-4-phosphate dehydrogenase PdxA [Candidatus Marinamargulisbacteria bacterium]